MTGQVTEVARPAGTWVPRVIVGGAAAAPLNSALPGRTVAVDQPQGPRNPIVRALTSFGRLLTRLCTRSQSGSPRNLSPQERAARDTRTHLSNFFRHLSSPAQSPRNSKAVARMATDLRKLAAAQRTLGTNQNKVLQDAVEELLDSQWPGESALELVAALRSPTLAGSQKAINAKDPDAERLLILIEQHLNQVVMKRAEATIGRELELTFEKIRQDALPTDIQEQAHKALETAKSVINQLRQSKLLTSVGADTWRRRERILAEETARILHSHIAASGASGEEIGALLAHLSSEALAMLATEEKMETPIVPALQHEIATRIPRLMAELERVMGGGRTEERQRANTILSSSLNDKVQKVAALYREIIVHNGAFGEKVDQAKLHGLLKQLEQEVSGIGSAHIRPTGRGTELAEAAKIAEKLFGSEVTEDLKLHWATEISHTRATASARLQAVIDTLGTRHHDHDQTSQYLIACKDMVTALQQHLLTTGEVSPAQVTEPERLAHELRQLINSLPEGQRQATTSALQMLRSAEMVSAARTLAEAARQAKQRNLPQLHIELSDMVTAMEVVASTLDPEGRNVNTTGRRGSGTPNVPALSEPTLVSLAQHFSTKVDDGGHVTLTAGHCGETFTAKAREVIERPFSATEADTKLLAGNVRVPTQFWLDAERSSTIYLGPDGEPLINRKDWGRLTTLQKEERVADGYRKLLSLYEGNERQTETIMLLANQGITAGLFDAARFANADSPMQLAGFGRGVTNRASMNTDELTTIRFFKSDNHRPQLELSYEIRGGRYDLVDDSGFNTGQGIYLDRNRSRAKFSVSVEADASQGKLHLLDAPVYDIHLVRSPIQQPFSLPKVADFMIANSKPLYDVAIPFAEGRSAGEANALRAMRTLTGWKHEPEWRRVLQLRAQHLRPDAPYPISQKTQTVLRVGEVIDQVDRQLAGVFDTAELAARQLLEHSPSLSSHQAQTLNELLGNIEKFKANPDRTPEDAAAILRVFPLASGDEGSSDEVRLPADAVAQTYDALNSVKQLMDGEMRTALLALLAKDMTANAQQLLPDFREALMAEAAADLDPVYI